MKKIFFVSLFVLISFYFLPQDVYAHNIELNSICPKKSGLVSFRQSLSRNLPVLLRRFPLEACGNDIVEQTINKLQPEKFQLQKITFTVSDSWFSRDKAHHFLTSAFLTTAGYYYCREQNHFSNFKSQQGAVCFSLSLGLIKEIRDGMKKNNAFSWKDLVADILGTAVGLAIISD